MPESANNPNSVYGSVSDRIRSGGASPHMQRMGGARHNFQSRDDMQPPYMRHKNGFDDMHEPFSSSPRHEMHDDDILSQINDMVEPRSSMKNLGVPKSKLSEDPHALTSSDDIDLSDIDALDEELSDMDKDTDNIDDSVPQENSNEVNSVQATNLDDINPKSIIWIVWVLVILLIAVIIVFNNSKGDKKKEAKTVKESSSVGQFYPLPQVQTGSDMWTDYMHVSKTIEIQSANIQPLLTGYAENYKANVVIPVSLDKYNSISEGTRIAIHFNELQVNGNSYINIISWEVTK